MTVGRRQYNEAEMMQMQREAEARVREMQRRARQTLAQRTPDDLPPPPGWTPDPAVEPEQTDPPAAAETQEAQPEPDAAPQAEGLPPIPPQASVPPPAQPKGTIIGDVMNALGLDEDYLLIIGLLLLLINQRADTTLILALVYLLI